MSVFHLIAMRFFFLTSQTINERCAKNWSALCSGYRCSYYNRLCEQPTSRWEAMFSSVIVSHFVYLTAVCKPIFYARQTHQDQPWGNFLKYLELIKLLREWKAGWANLYIKNNKFKSVKFTTLALLLCIKYTNKDHFRQHRHRARVRSCLHRLPIATWFDAAYR